MAAGSMAHSTFTRALSLSSLLFAGLGASACTFGGGYESAYLEAEDVSLELPSAAEDFRAEGDLRGDAWWWANQTAADVNGWVTTVVETSGYIVAFLDDHRETSLDGAWRVYGPFDDEGGREVAWMVRVIGNELDTEFEFLVAPRGSVDPAAFELLSEGSLTVADDLRYGSVHIDFDTLESYPGLDTTLLWRYAGDVVIDFERDVASGEKTIALQFEGFEAKRTGYLDDDEFSSDETYAYHRAADGSGSFHLALMGEWDSYGWSGPERERMQLDMRWQASGAGRARGLIEEVDGVGDMLHGDFALHECFDAEGYLDWRELSALYAELAPGYNFGDASSCVFTDAAL
ncbi:hypothetical protein G6O69_15590 [Pseudenhygromyxa sp. WMMC2535]|uniref:hypothetical protein n=1 Tax=Pseudenhygromyxa sp. WMMC2535 TaxID=2712867 RepID=UPI00155642F6|nr:hypothetical protein [Pseudenhygromyxa sp. WMMC2535]NVB39266.1 hypothetical protein [Pseudenhygromyxa sp. WMMC2535]